MKRVLVLAVQYALHQSGMTMQAAAEYIGDQRPDLKSLMTRGQSLPETIQRWRRDVDSAKEHESFGRCAVLYSMMRNWRPLSSNFRRMASSQFSAWSIFRHSAIT
jgi:hypothetical protein